MEEEYMHIKQVISQAVAEAFVELTNQRIPYWRDKT